MGRKKTCGIYKITSPKGKIYIGQSVNIERRFSSYRSLQCPAQTKLHRSLKKYGPENHKFEILHICDRDDMNKLESYYEELYDSTNFKTGLNLRKCGDKREMTEETRIKISESAKKVVRKPEHLERSRILCYNLGKAGAGKKLSQETKFKIYLANIGKIQPKTRGFLHHNSKTVLDLETGIFYGSAREAADAFLLNYATLKDKLNGRRGCKKSKKLIYV